MDRTGKRVTRLMWLLLCTALLLFAAGCGRGTAPVSGGAGTLPDPAASAPPAEEPPVEEPPAEEPSAQPQPQEPEPPAEEPPAEEPPAPEEPPHVHDWDEGAVTREPTCTEAGEETFRCRGCGEEKTEELSPLGHDYGPWLPGEEEHYRICARNENHWEVEAHDWDGGTVAEEGTDLAAALEKHTCPVCGETRWLRAFTLDGGTPFYLISAWNGETGGESVLLQIRYAQAPDREVRYRWLACDDTGKNAAPVAGAEGPELYTGILTSTGVYGWFCEITYSVPPEGAERTCRTPLYRVAYTGLPTLRIDTKNGKPVTSRDESVSGTLTLLPGSSLSGQGVEGAAITIKGRGNSTWFMPKKGYNVKFSDKQNLFGLGKDKKWSLIANYSDKSLLRNWLAGELTARVFQSDRWQPTYVPVDLVLNGEYLGSYVLVPSIKISSARVDIPDISAPLEEDTSGDGAVDLWDGGYILEVEDRLNTTWYFRTEQGVPFTLKDPDMDSGAEGDWTASQIAEHIQSHIQTVEDVLYSDGFADPETGWRKYLDADSAVDWYLVNELTRNNDAAFYSSVYMVYDPADGMLYMGPNWDFDISCGNINYNSNEETAGYWIRYAKWMERLVLDPSFVQQVKERWTSCRPALEALVEEAIPRQAELLTVSARMNFTKWPILGSWVWPNDPGYWQRTTYGAEVAYLQSWLRQRIAWLDGELYIS